jgi:hypothetical protein
MISDNFLTLLLLTSGIYIHRWTPRYVIHPPQTPYLQNGWVFGPNMKVSEPLNS